MNEPPESDWKYLRRIQPEMLEELSRRGCDEIRAVLAAPDLSESAKRMQIYDLVHTQDGIVAACFDDWRRSRFFERCLALRRHGLLREEHLRNFTPETRAQLALFE